MISCYNRKNIEAEIAEFTNSKVIFEPQKMVTQIHGKDTVYNYRNDKLKLIVFFDKETCTSCVIDGLYDWNDFIADFKKNERYLKVFFIFAPPPNEMRNISISFKNSIIDYPIFIDTAGIFKKRNLHLPKEKVLHTFLLNKNNEVILIGNPLYNKKINQMFKEIVEEKLGNKE